MCDEMRKGRSNVGLVCSKDLGWVWSWFESGKLQQARWCSDHLFLSLARPAAATNDLQASKQATSNLLIDRQKPSKIVHYHYSSLPLLSGHLSKPSKAVNQKGRRENAVPPHSALPGATSNPPIPHHLISHHTSILPPPPTPAKVLCPLPENPPT